MTPILRTTLLYSLVPVLCTIAGAAAGAFVPGMVRLRGHVLHLAAGVVFGVVAVELLPEIQRRALVGDVVLGLALGIATMLAADKLIDRIRGDDTDGDSGATVSSPVSASLFVAVAIDFLLDGLLLGVGFAAGARIGILLAPSAHSSLSRRYLARRCWEVSPTGRWRSCSLSAPRRSSTW